MKKFLILCVIMFISAISGIFPQGKFSGKVYADYFYNISSDTSINSVNNSVVGGTPDLNGIQFRRIYLTYDYKISETFSSRVRLEMDSDALTSNGKISPFVKDAYLKWNDIFPGSDLIAGIQPTPAFQISESYWGYRSLNKTILDLRGFVSSRDIAVSLKGRFSSSDILQYWIMFGNSSGNRPETNKYKRIYAHLNYHPIENMNITVYGDIKFQPRINDPNNQDNKIGNNSITTSLFIGYREKGKFSTGVKGFFNTVQNEIFEMPVSGVIPVENANAFGISIFGSYEFSELIGIVARYDYFDPLTGSGNEGNSRNFFVGGFSYNPHPDVSIIPNLMVETYEDLPNGQSIDPSLTGRITLAYNF